MSAPVCPECGREDFPSGPAGARLLGTHRSQVHAVAGRSPAALARAARGAAPLAPVCAECGRADFAADANGRRALGIHRFFEHGVVGTSPAARTKRRRVLRDRTQPDRPRCPECGRSDFSDDARGLRRLGSHRRRAHGIRGHSAPTAEQRRRDEHLEREARAAAGAPRALVEDLVARIASLESAVRFVRAEARDARARATAPRPPAVPLRVPAPYDDLGFYHRMSAPERTAAMKRFYRENADAPEALVEDVGPMVCDGCAHEHGDLAWSGQQQLAICAGCWHGEPYPCSLAPGAPTQVCGVGVVMSSAIASDGKLLRPREVEGVRRVAFDMFSLDSEPPENALPCVAAPAAAVAAGDPAADAGPPPSAVRPTYAPLSERRRAERLRKEAEADDRDRTDILAGLALHGSVSAFARAVGADEGMMLRRAARLRITAAEREAALVRRREKEAAENVLAFRAETGRTPTRAAYRRRFGRGATARLPKGSRAYAAMLAGMGLSPEPAPAGRPKSGRPAAVANAPARTAVVEAAARVVRERRAAAPPGPAGTAIRLVGVGKGLLAALGEASSGGVQARVDGVLVGESGLRIGGRRGPSFAEEPAPSARDERIYRWEDRARRGR